MRKPAPYLINGEISASSFSAFVQFLETEVHDGVKAIEIAICSNGGSVSVGVAWSNFLRSMPYRVKTYNLGNVDSAAIPVFAAGTERFCARHATFMLHPIAKRLAGVYDADALRTIAKEIDSDSTLVSSLLAERTNQTISYWRKLMRQQTIIDSRTAFRIGLVSKISCPKQLRIRLSAHVQPFLP